MSELPKFLLADNSEYPDDVFVVHTDFPRFILNIVSEEVEWLEEFDEEDEKELTSEAERLIGEALAFYEREIEDYE